MEIGENTKEKRKKKLSKFSENITELGLKHVKTIPKSFSRLFFGIFRSGFN